MIPVASTVFGKEEKREILDCLEKNWVTKGPKVDLFEKRFSSYCSGKYGTATNNGTSALHTALMAIDIRKGDEVILPSLTFISTANVVLYCNANPVFIDSHPDYWCIDPEKIEEKITRKTKAIIPVHLYGHPCDMGPILDIAEDHGLYVIEDAAEAHGAEYKGGKVGALGDIGCFSFYANKIITTGEGGMCVTNNTELYERMRLLLDQGMPEKGRRYYHTLLGFNYRMTDLQAAIGLAQLKKINGFIMKKRRIASEYSRLLEGVDGIRLPVEMEWARSVYWMYSLLIEGETRGCIGQADVMTRLRERGIDSRPFFHPCHMQPYMRKYGGKTRLPVAEFLGRNGINLPSGVDLTRGDINRVCYTLKEILLSSI